MHLRSALTGCFLLVSFLTFAQGTSPDAASVLLEAGKEAAVRNKKVFVLFHASWCGWCRKMDTALADPSVKPAFDASYVTCHLVVYESKDKKHLENKGAFELLQQYRGDDLGIPYWMVFDAKGVLLADAQIRGAGSAPEGKGVNTGCPATAEEVEHFISVLQKTSRMSAEELHKIRLRFRQNEE